MYTQDLVNRLESLKNDVPTHIREHECIDIAIRAILIISLYSNSIKTLNKEIERFEEELSRIKR